MAGRLPRFAGTSANSTCMSTWRRPRRERCERLQLQGVSGLHHPGHGHGRHLRGLLSWKEGDEARHLQHLACADLVLHDELDDAHAVCWRGGVDDRPAPELSR